jgi:vacuolar-type H+-ATPase subunit H
VALAGIYSRRDHPRLPPQVGGICTLKARQVELNEVYLFKVDSPLTASPQPPLTLHCSLFNTDCAESNLVNTYSGLVTGCPLHDYLEIDFSENVPCQLTGSIHRCPYRYSFIQEGQAVDLKGFCDKNAEGRGEEIIRFLERESEKQGEEINQSYRQIARREASAVLPKVTSQQSSKVVLSCQDLSERDALLTQADEESPEPIALEAKRRRRRIFSTTREERQEYYLLHERRLHEQAQQIYAVWRDLIGALFTAEAEFYLSARKREYRNHLVGKVGESVSRFQGEWDIDRFSEEADSRNRLADKLRQPAASEEECPGDDLLSVANEGFLSRTRPVFFEEQATRSQREIEDESAEEIFVVLVHGLGACRLDMEKLKVEMRRYYEGKVRVYASSANEGRTEGDIDSMGLRLAAEI